MPGRCVVGGCSNTASLEKGIGLHVIPFFGDTRPEAKKRRKRWVDFVKLKRAKWEPSKSSVICSAHFHPTDFERRFHSLPGQSLQFPRLNKDEIGVCVYPTVQVGSTEQSQTERSKRKIINEAIKSSQASATLNSTSTSTVTTHVVEQDESDLQGTSTDSDPTVMVEEPMDLDESTESLAEGESLELPQKVNYGTGCTTSCHQLQSENRQLRNKVKSLRMQLTAKRDSLKSCQSSRRRLASKLQKQIQASKKTSSKDVLDVPESSMPFSSDSEVEGEADNDIYETETETETDVTTESEYEGIHENPTSLTVTGTNLRTEPKHIVFLSQLLLLFKFCHVCKTDNPSLEARQVGTEAVVTTTCSNPKCPKQVSMLHSQPVMPGTGIPAANFLLCMAILLAGGSAKKVLQIFMHMGLGCVSLNTYFKYQRSKLFPTVHLYWKKYQANLLEKVKAISGGVILAEDGHHDSMGTVQSLGHTQSFVALCQ